MRTQGGPNAGYGFLWSRGGRVNIRAQRKVQWKTEPHLDICLFDACCGNNLFEFNKGWHHQESPQSSFHNRLLLLGWISFRFSWGSDWFGSENFALRKRVAPWKLGRWGSREIPTPSPDNKYSGTSHTASQKESRWRVLLCPNCELHFCGKEAKKPRW